MLLLRMIPNAYRKQRCKEYEECTLQNPQLTTALSRKFFYIYSIYPHSYFMSHSQLFICERVCLVLYSCSAEEPLVSNHIKIPTGCINQTLFSQVLLSPKEFNRALLHLKDLCWLTTAQAVHLHWALCTAMCTDSTDTRQTFKLGTPPP